MTVSVQIGTVQFQMEAKNPKDYVLDILAAISGVPSKIMKDDILNDDEMRRVMEASKVMRNVNIFVGPSKTKIELVRT